MSGCIQINNTTQTGRHIVAELATVQAARHLSAIPGHSTNWWAITVQTLIESIFGLTAGSAAGWTGGWCGGLLYSRYFRPACVLDLSEVTRWWMMPHTFARTGVFVGAGLGLAIILLLTKKVMHSGQLHCDR